MVVKSWINGKDNSHNYDVYVRMYNGIVNYQEDQIERYMVRHKYLSEEEIEYQYDTVHGM